MKITNYSSEQEKISYEIASNPELQKSELAPKAKKVCWHEQIYKTLATVGDFSCFVLYFDENYDPTRTSQGTRRIHIVGSETRIEDELELNKYHSLSDAVFSEGVIYVNAIIRPNGTTFQNNKDLKDCVKFMSGVANHYGASKDKIFAIDPNDNDKMYEMSYDVSSAKTYSDNSNNSLGDFTSIAIGGGTLSLSYGRLFGSGSIAFSQIKSAFGGDNNIDKYHRGENIADITENASVPTFGEISFSDFRNIVSSITANANGNWMHLQARWEIFGDAAWVSELEKTLNINGQVGPADSSTPAVRINEGGQGQITLRVNGGANTVRGWPGNGGTGSNNGQAGGTAMVVSSPIRMPTSHYNGRVGGGGGGGGGGGQGGDGGAGGHSGGRRCNPGFCWNTHQYCNNNGGCGGNGGAGGTGGRGNGYYYDYGLGMWIDSHNAGLAAGTIGSPGSSGGSRAGAGGQGGAGGNGGALETKGADGAQGGTGGTGAGQYGGCGVGCDGNRSGDVGAGGNGGGPAGVRVTTSHSGNVSLF